MILNPEPRTKDHSGAPQDWSISPCFRTTRCSSNIWIQTSLPAHDINVMSLAFRCAQCSASSQRLPWCCWGKGATSRFLKKAPISWVALRAPEDMWSYNSGFDLSDPWAQRAMCFGRLLWTTIGLESHGISSLLRTIQDQIELVLLRYEFCKDIPLTLMVTRRVALSLLTDSEGISGRQEMVLVRGFPPPGRSWWHNSWYFRFSGWIWYDLMPPRWVLPNISGTLSSESSGLGCRLEALCLSAEVDTKII